MTEFVVFDEDFKGIVEEMKKFRTETAEKHLQNKTQTLLNSRNALTKRWVVFYQNMINIGIFELLPPIIKRDMDDSDSD